MCIRDRRLSFLNDAGLNYLTLDRECSSLSGGEAQRVRLATQLGLGLVGVTYVLDEPSIGLHPSDHQRLIGSIRGLRDLGNTILVVEHDRDMMLAAGHTHYRALFLGACCLFLLTFVINTLAEVLRQRLRERYKVV